MLGPPSRLLEGTSLELKNEPTYLIFGRIFPRIFARVTVSVAETCFLLGTELVNECLVGGVVNKPVHWTAQVANRARDAPHVNLVWRRHGFATASSSSFCGVVVLVTDSNTRPSFNSSCACNGWGAGCNWAVVPYICPVRADLCNALWFFCCLAFCS